MNRTTLSQSSGRNNKKEINLKAYFDLFKRKFWVLVLFILLATLVGLYSYYLDSADETTYIPQYQSSTRIIIGGGGGDMVTMMVLITDPIVIERVKEDLALEDSVPSIAERISVNQIEESQVVNISATDTDPEIAAAIVNSTAMAYKQEMLRLLEYEGITLLSEADVPNNPINSPSNHNSGSFNIIFPILGFVIGIGFIYLLDSLDGKVRNEQELETELEIPVLGSVSNMNKKKYVQSNKMAKEKNTRLRSDPIGSKQS